MSSFKECVKDNSDAQSETNEVSSSLLSSLSEFYESLHTCNDERTILARIRSVLQEGLGFDYVSLYYYNSESGQFTLRDAPSILGYENLDPITMPDTSSERGVLILDAEVHPFSRYLPNQVSLLTLVPMRSHGNSIGMIEVAFMPHRSVSDLQIKALKTIASMSGNALERMLCPQHRDTTDIIARNVLNSPHQFVLTTDFDGRTKMVNSTFSSYTGFWLEDIPTMDDWYKFLSHENYLKFKAVVRQILSTAGPISIQNTIYGGEGKEAHVSWMCSPLYDKSDVLSGVVCVGYDVSTVVNIEHKLNQLYLLLGKKHSLQSEEKVIAMACNILYSAFEIDAIRVVFDGLDGRRHFHISAGDINPVEPNDRWHEPYVDAVSTYKKPYTSHMVDYGSASENVPVFACPLDASCELQGVVCISFFPGHHIDDTEKSYIVAVCDFISIALSNIIFSHGTMVGRDMLSVFEKSPSLFLVKLDNDMGVKLANDTILEALHIEREKFGSLGQLRPFTSEVDYDTLLGEIRHVILSNEPSTHILSMDNKETHLVLSLEVSPYHSYSGDVAGVVVLGKDITEVIVLESDLQESLSFNAGILDTISMGICVSGTDYTALRANPAFVSLVASSEDALIGASILDMFPPSLANQFSDLYDKSLSTMAPQSFTYCGSIGAITGTYNVSIVPYVPTRAPCPVSYHPPPCEHEPSSVKVITIFNDISELQQTKKQLSEKDDMLLGVFDNACEGYIVLSRSDDGEYIIEGINKLALQMCDKPYDELVGGKIIDVLPQMASSGLVEIINNVYHTGSTFEHDEFRCSSLNGIVLQLSIFLAGKNVVMSLKDVSERVSNSYALRDQALALEEKNNELERFIYHISHDLRSPLTILQGMTAILNEDFKDILGKDGAYYLSRININVDRLNTYIIDLLKLSRADKSNAPPVAVDVFSLVNDIVSVCSKKYPSAVVTVGALPRVIYERELLQQLFHEVIENAFIYSSNSDVQRISIVCTERKQDYLFSISDNGIGIEQRYIEKIFKVFERLCDIDTPGTGIGLALAERIVSNHQGDIWVESTLGEGSTFSFTINKEEEDMHGI